MTQSWERGKLAGAAVRANYKYPADLQDNNGEGGVKSDT
jgi:hypothetical protein